jgi:hypothetical protein
MDLTLLATLKEKIASAKDFGSVWSYFFDHFGEDPAFIALGERTQDAFLEAILLQVGGELFGRQVALGNLLLTRLPEHHFIHGGFTLGGKLANVIYFDDIQTGLLAVLFSVTPSETKMVRFTGRRMPSGGTPSRN